MRSPHARSGFTKMELLVSIFIVVILLGLLLPAIHPAHRGIKAEAKSDLVQFCMAVNAYYTDYGRYPIDPKVHWSGNAVYGLPGQTRHNSDVVNALMADGTDRGPNHDDALNPKQVIYLDVPDVINHSDPRDGLGDGHETNRSGVTAPHEWYDPYGSPYLLIIDATHTGHCDAGLIYSDFSAPPNAGVIGICLGADKQYGNAGNRLYNGSDDVASW